MHRDCGVETDSTDEDGDDDATSAGSELWAIADASLDASMTDSILAFPRETVSTFPIMEEVDVLELPTLFPGSMASVLLALPPAEPSFDRLLGRLLGELFYLGLLRGPG